MAILIFDDHWQLSAIISPYKFMLYHFSEDRSFLSKQTCDVSVRTQQAASFSEKLFSEKNNWFCQSNLEKQRKSYVTLNINMLTRITD